MLLPACEPRCAGRCVEREYIDLHYPADLSHVYCKPEQHQNAAQVTEVVGVLQTLLTGLKQLLFALSHYGAKAHARPGMPAALLQASRLSLHAHCGEAQPDALPVLCLCITLLT